MTKAALIIVDVQNDFCEGGSLAVEGGKEVASKIADLLQSDHGYDLIVTTYDWHKPEGPEHFAAPGTDPDYNETWPAHCVAGTEGAKNPEVLTAAFNVLDDAPGTPPIVDVYKGQSTAAFSGFEGTESANGDYGSSLQEILDYYEIDEVDICGLALDYCVKATALDAVNFDFDVNLLLDLTAAVNPDNTQDVLGVLQNVGVVIA